MDEVIFLTVDEYVNAFWDLLISWMNDHGYQILLIIFLAYIVKKFGVEIIMKVLEKTVRKDLYPTKTDRIKRIKTLKSMIGAILQVVIIIVAIIMIVSELGLNTTPIIASAGILGIALGFGAQSLIKDLTSGLFIILENQYRVGDVIDLNNEIKGEVKAITIRTTVIRNIDGTLYHVPNGTISWTANKTMSYGGIAEEIVFPHDIDISRLKIIIDRIGDEMVKNPEFEKKIKEPPRLDSVLGFHNDGIRIRVVARTSSDDAFVIKDNFYQLLIKELRKAKIEIPSQRITINQKTPKK